MKKLNNTEAELKKAWPIKDYLKFPSFRFLLLSFFRDKYVSRSFAITFETISHKKILLNDSCHVEPHKFSLILSSKQKKKK